MRMSSGPHRLDELVTMRRPEAGPQHPAFIRYAKVLQTYGARGCSPQRFVEIGTSMMLLADVPWDTSDEVTPTLMLAGATLKSLLRYDSEALARMAQAATQWDMLIDHGFKSGNSHLRAMSSGMRYLRDPRRDRVAFIEWTALCAALAVNSLSGWADVPGIISRVDEGMHKTLRLAPRKHFEMRIAFG